MSDVEILRVVFLVATVIFALMTVYRVLFSRLALRVLPVAILCACCVLGATTTGAWADGPNGGGYLDGDNIGAGVGDGNPGNGTPDGDGGWVDTGTTGSAAPNPFQWRRVYYDVYDGVPVGSEVCPGPGTIGPAGAWPPDVPVGRPYFSELVNTDTGAVVSTSQQQGCEMPGVADPPPPAPPSVAEARDRTPLPAPAWGVDPQGDGMVNLTTLLWDPTGAGGRDVSATVRGWTVTTHAEPQAWRWTMAKPDEPGPASQTNPNPVVSASRPGSAADPAARYTYETAGDYTLTLRVSWVATYTFSGNGVPPQTVPLGTIVRSSSRTYHVAQLRPVLEGLSTT